MCMLFIKPSDFTLNDDYFLSLWEHNPHGLSVYNLNNGELFKTLEYDTANQYLLDNHQNELIAHFRLATSGQRTLQQLHGFNICNDKYLLFHNGVLKTFKGTDLLSDTQEIAVFFANKSIDYVVDYLQTHEKTSRFLLVKKSTNEVIKPQCAKWHHGTIIDDKTIYFSNDYAIDYALLYPDCDDFYFYDDDFSELDYIIKCNDKKTLLGYIQVNPDIVSDYLLLGY